MRSKKDECIQAPVVAITVSTPLKANFDGIDSEIEGSTTPVDLDADSEKSIKSLSRSSTADSLTSLFHHSKEPLPDHSDISYGKSHWRSICNLLLAIFATLGSAITLAVAIWQPFYGNFISPTGRLSPSTANFLFSLFAKSIEIASSGLYVNFLGQFLTRRSLRSRGISVDDIQIRDWLAQPGLVILDLGKIKYALTTVLGISSLFAATAIYFFTSASNSLVSPHIAMGKWRSAQFNGNVQQDFGNVILLKQDCWSPIDSRLDGQNLGESCANVLASGLANQDMNNYMKSWAAEILGGKNASSNLSSRPQATSAIFTDTVTQGSWVQKGTADISTNFMKYGRVVNNITLSMPHPVVYYSAEVEFPEVIRGSGLGEHTIKASVVSPTSNTLCVNMAESEVAPLVYVTWPNARYIQNNATGGHKVAIGEWESHVPANLTSWPNITETNVGTIFKWGSAYNRNPPVFPQYPIDFNSISNISVSKSDSIYLLMKSPNTTDYTICQMYGYLSGSCSTKHTQIVGKRTISTSCGDDDNTYDATIAPTVFNRAPSTDFRDVLGEWSLATGLDGGLISSNSSLVHTLSQLVVTSSNNGTVPTLNRTMPSLSEALAVLSSSMLMKGSINATFDNHTIKHAPTSPTSYPYQVMVQEQQYRSGPSAEWQGILYPILVVMFMANLYCLMYFLRDMGLLEDILEPQNLFSVAINSQSESRGRTTGERPIEEHGGTKWTMRRDRDRRLAFARAGQEDCISSGVEKRYGCHFIGFDKETF